LTDGNYGIEIENVVKKTPSKMILYSAQNHKSNNSFITARSTCY